MVATAKVNLAAAKTTLTAVREKLAAVVNPKSNGEKKRSSLIATVKIRNLDLVRARNPRQKESSNSHLWRSNEGWLGSIFERENTLKTHFPCRFSPKLKEQGQESKPYLGFLHL